MRAIPAVSQYVPLWFINKKLIPAFHSMTKFFEDHVPVSLLIPFCTNKRLMFLASN